MKNIIYITGAPRCGKSTLANHLAGYNAPIFSLDALSKSVRNVFKDFKLYSKPVCIQPDINKEDFLKIVEVYVNSFFEDFKDKTIIIEGCHFTPSEFKSKFPSSKIICLGRTKSIEDIKTAIRSKSWMADFSEETICDYADLIYAHSAEMKKLNGEYLYFETDEINIDLIQKYLSGGK